MSQKRVINGSKCKKLVVKCKFGRALSLYPQNSNSLEIKMKQTILVWSNQNVLRPQSVKVVYFEWCGHFGHSDRNVPFHSTKILLLSPAVLICIMQALLVHIQYSNVWWLGSGLRNWNIPLHWACGISEISNWIIFGMESAQNFC